MMRARIATVVVLAAAVCPAFAANVIREWGGHTPSDYDIWQVGGEDVGVVILRNSQPLLPWKFEAYDSVTQAPGDINFIRIDSGTTVGNITLSVIGQWPHTYGARDLKLVNLVDYGASSNVIDEINISRNAGEDGDLEAYGADSVTIGAKLGPYDLHISGPVTGDVTLSGTGPHTGDIFVGGTSYAGEMYFGGDMDGDIEFSSDFDGEIEIEGDLAGMITIGQDAGSNSLITFFDVGSTGGVDIGRDFEGVIAKPDEPYGQTCQGTFHVTGDTKQGSAITLGDLESPGTIEIDGDCDGGINLRDLESGASIQIDGYCDGGLEFWGIFGTFDVAGDFGGTFQCRGNFTGSIDLYSLSGSLELEWGLGREELTTGEMTIEDDVSGSIDIRKLDSAGTISIGGNFSGDITVGEYADDDLDGTLSIDGNVSGTIDLTGDVTGTITIGTDAASSADLTGTIDVGGDMKGVIRVTGDVEGDIEIAGDMEDPLGDLTAGHIIVDGTFVDEADIIIDGEFAGDTEYIAIDYDGFDLADSWESGAQVWIDSTSYGGNTPAEHLWEITCQKGDMTNDGVVTTFDIDPFTMVINEELEDYEEDYPGLLGSVEFHADMNCDGDVDYFDVDAFVLRLFYPEDYCEEYYDPETCYDCDCAAEESLGGGGGGASEVAAVLLEYVDSERLPVIVDAAEELASYYADTPRGEFWAAVVEALKP